MKMTDNFNFNYDGENWRRGTVIRQWVHDVLFIECSNFVQYNVFLYVFDNVGRSSG